MTICYVGVARARRRAVDANRADGDRGPERGRAAGAATGLDRHLQLPGIRADGLAVRDQPLPQRPARDSARRPGIPVHRRQVGRTSPSVYGPAFTVFSYLLAPLAVGASVLVYKSIAAVSSLGIVALVFNAARLRGVNPVRAAALVGLNPLLVLYGVGGGHNDLLMLLAMVAAVYAILRSRERLGGGLAVLAIGIKLTAGILLPFAIAAGGPLRRRGRRRDLLIGAGTVVAVLGSAHARAVRPRRVEYALDDPAQPERGRLAQPPGRPIDPARRRHRGHMSSAMCSRPRSWPRSFGSCFASGAARWTGSTGRAGRQPRCW